MTAMRSDRLIATWLADSDAGAARQLDPVQELSAEHALIRPVMSRIVAKAADLRRGAAFEARFWGAAVSFLRGFVGDVHERKEELVLLPHLLRQGRIDGQLIASMSQDHGRVEEIVDSICDAIEHAEWRRLCRAVEAGAHYFCFHLDGEDEHLGQLDLGAGRPGIWTEIHAGYQKIEAACALPGGRGEVYDLAIMLADGHPPHSAQRRGSR